MKVSASARRPVRFMSSRAARISFSFALIPSGALLIALTAGGVSATGTLNLPRLILGELGLALLVTGLIALYEELLLSPAETEEAAERIAGQLKDQIVALSQSQSALRLDAEVRYGYKGYYSWIIDPNKQDLFFAGRSVLHRIDDDCRKQELSSAEARLYEKMRLGSNIRIMFLDPRSDLIPRLAQSEAQYPESMVADITASLGICKRLQELLEATPLKVGSLDIRVYDEIPYFAYHKVDNHLVVGFYFTSALGHASSAYVVEDLRVMRSFDDHFETLYRGSERKRLLYVSPTNMRPVFNEQLFLELSRHCEQKLGSERYAQLVKR